MEQVNYRHYRSMDIYGNGVGYNVVIIKEEENGDVYFIKEEDLDGVDARRMRSILSRRDVDRNPLWDVMSQITLKNGMNALEYFHQLVKIRTPSGQILSPSNSRRGMRRNMGIRPNPAPQSAPQPAQQPAQQAAPAAQQVKESAQQAEETPKRKPGRPRKKRS